MFVDLILVRIEAAALNPADLGFQSGAVNPLVDSLFPVTPGWPPDEVWKELTDFAGYAQWHPVLRFADVPTEILPGTQLRAQVALGTENDGEYNNGEYSFTVLHYESPRRLVWEGGIPDVLTGQHSFVLEPRDGGTRFTESEEFTGTAAVETVESARSKMEEDYASYGRALKKRLESGH